MNEKVRQDLAQLTPQQLEELRTLVSQESQKRGQWDRLTQMSGNEFDVFMAEQCAAGDAELRNAALAKQLKNGDGNG